MNVPEISEVKDHLDKLVKRGMVQSWELPYENLLTRRSAAIFFVMPLDNNSTSLLENELSKYENFSMRPNAERKLSDLPLRITFSKEEKEKNTKIEAN